MIEDFHRVGTSEDIEKLKIIESENEMTEDRCLNTNMRNAIISCTFLALKFIYYLLALIGEKNTLSI